MPAAGELTADVTRLIGCPIALLVGTHTLVIGTDLGEWCTIGPADEGDELRALAPTGRFAAAVIDDAGAVTVACWQAAVKQLRDGAWVEVTLVAPPVALAVCARGVIAGDADGGLTIVPVGSRIPVQELSAAAPVVELCVTGDRLVVLDSAGTLATTEWPARTESRLVAIDASALGRVHTLCAGMRAGTAIVIGDRGMGVLEGASLGAIVIEPFLRAVIAFGRGAGGGDRACVISDTGAAWIVDASLARVTRLRGGDLRIDAGIAMPDGAVLAWTADGELHAIAADGNVRRLADGGVVLAAADPDDASRYIAIHWTPASGTRVSRGGGLGGGAGGGRAGASGTSEAGPAWN